jgi:two-component system chemotaxis response regulator CheY
MKKVMFVDDSATALSSTKIATGSMDIEVKQFLSAPEALEEINSGFVPDLIITDLYMPQMDGFEFLEEVRKIGSVKRTPVLMLTTEARDEMKQKGKALGLTGWIIKPFTSSQLKAAIAKVLRIDI